MAKPIEYTNQELKKSLHIVSDHLFHTLLNNPPNTKVRLGSIGYLVKKERQISNGMGNFIYYHCGFQKSRPFKRALDEQVNENFAYFSKK